MPIGLAPTGQDLKVVKVLTDEKTKKHLESLGITVNSHLQVVSTSGGTVILQVKSGRLALDKSTVNRIFVI